MNQVAPVLDELARRMSAVSPAWAEVVTVADDATPFVDAPALDEHVLLGVETIREGWLLHHGESRVARAASPDLALLVGDWCYADGLREVTRHGTLEQVATLAGLVADISAAADASPDEHGSRWAAALADLSRPAHRS